VGLVALQDCNIALALSTPFRVLILGFRWVIDALGRKAGLRLPGSLPAMAQGKEHGLGNPCSHQRVESPVCGQVCPVLTIK